MEAPSAGTSQGTHGPSEVLGQWERLHAQAVVAVETVPLPSIVWEQDEPRGAFSASADPIPRVHESTRVGPEPPRNCLSLPVPKRATTEPPVSIKT